MLNLFEMNQVILIQALLYLVTFSIFNDTIYMTLPIITFHQIYNMYAAGIMRFAYWLSGNKDDAKDLTSDAFVRLWTTSSNIEVKTVKMYLITIVRNLYLQKIQKDKSKTILHEGIHDSKESIESIVEIRSDLSNVMNHLQSLPEIDRTALLLYAHDEMTYQQIAEYLEITLANVKVKISRTRKILQELRNGEK